MFKLTYYKVFSSFFIERGSRSEKETWRGSASWISKICKTLESGQHGLLEVGRLQHSSRKKKNQLGDVRRVGNKVQLIIKSK
jgi:hypothetical protein